MERSDELTGPPVVGEHYLVPCYVEKGVVTELDYEYRDGELVQMPVPDVLTPIINHLHSDKENGQQLPHYHADYRFEPYGINQLAIIGSTARIYPGDDHYKNKKIEYRRMVCVSQHQKGVTPVNLIRKSTLKHKCIHKGKCPHRGYDMSTVIPVDGVITCPLHGLQFDSNTKRIISDPMLKYLLDKIEEIKYSMKHEDENEQGLISQLNEHMNKLSKLYPGEFSKLRARYEEERQRAIMLGSMRAAMLLEPTNFVEVNSNYRKY